MVIQPQCICQFSATNLTNSEVLPVKPDRKPTIVTNNRCDSLIYRDAMNALARAGEVFVHGGKLCRMSEFDVIMPLTSPGLRYELAKAATWVTARYRRGMEIRRHVPVPGRIVAMIRAWGEWPELKAVKGGGR